jgi:hypothetical protein
MEVSSGNRRVRTMATGWFVALLVWSVFVSGIGFGSWFDGWPDWVRFVAVQAFSFPVFLPAVQFTYAEQRPRFVGVFALPSAVTTAGWLAFVSWPRLSTRFFVDLLPFAALFAGAFALSWCVVGYAVGTALQWKRDGEVVPKRTLARGCTMVVFSSVFVFISQALYWSIFVIGLGDSL